MVVDVDVVDVGTRCGGCKSSGCRCGSRCGSSVDVEVVDTGSPMDVSHGGCGNVGGMQIL